MGASQRPGGSGIGSRQGQGQGPGPARRQEQDQGAAAPIPVAVTAGTGTGAPLARSTAWEGALVAPAAAVGAARPSETGGARSARRAPGAEQATVELLIPLCQKAEYEAVKAALWQWRTRWRREITYSFKSNLRRRVGPARVAARVAEPPGPDPRDLRDLPDAADAADAADAPAGGGTEVLPTVWVVKASARALAELPGGYTRRIIPDLLPRWGVIACVRDQYTDTGRGERQYGTKHFAVGTEVYAHPPFSTGLYERALFTGLHRQTKRFVTVMQPTLRFEDWRVGEISHPVVLHEFRANGVWEHSGALEDARRLSHQMNERIFQLKITRPPLEPPIGPDIGPDIGPEIGQGPGLRAARTGSPGDDVDLDVDPGDLDGDSGGSPGDR